ncbi:MAG TPA: hypothetical protein DCR93_18065 [Cytophagales bacterium]|nr:hypothetical protein [Cytophagales bacterium]HAP61316.1 hypothetical protein [Cytophagales bacterium]
MKRFRWMALPLAVWVGGLLSSCEPEFPVPQASSAVAAFSLDVGDGFAPGTVTFTNESTVLEGFTATYAWNFGDGSSSTEASPSHEYAEAGTYTIQLVMTTEDDISVASQEISLLSNNALDVRLFFVDAGALRIEEVDGDGFAIDGFSTGLDYDAANNQLYWTDADAGTLMRANLDGSGVATVASGMGDIRDLALDVANDRAYVADRTNNAIWEIVLSTGATSELYTTTDDGLGQLPVGLDIYNGNLYITCVDIDAEAVWVGEVDGSGVTRILDFAAAGFGYGIIVDPINEHIYFDNSDAGTLLRADLDGGNITEVLVTNNRSYGMAVDAAGGKIYYSERATGNILRANLDGSDITVVASGFQDPRGLFIIP